MYHKHKQHMYTNLDIQKTQNENLANNFKKLDTKKVQ